MFGCEQNLWCWISNRGEALRSCQRAPRITLSLLLEQPICLHTNTHTQSAAYVPAMHGPRPYYNEQCHFYVCVSLKSMFAELRFERMDLKSKRQSTAQTVSMKWINDFCASVCAHFFFSRSWDVFAPNASAFIFIIWENVHTSACLSSGFCSACEFGCTSRRSYFY